MGDHEKVVTVTQAEMLGRLERLFSNAQPLEKMKFRAAIVGACTLDLDNGRRIEITLMAPPNVETGAFMQILQTWHSIDPAELRGILQSLAE